MRRAAVLAALLLGIGCLASTTAASAATGWSIQRPPNRHVSLAQGVASVACTTATACTAVGSLETTGAFAERWNGATWTIEPSADPSASPFSSLDGVACPTLTFCVAVGAAGGTSLIETWNGSTWSVDYIDSAPGNLAGVACASATSCVAVGSTNPGPVLVQWNGATWTWEIAPAPSGATAVTPDAVACVTGKACDVVGSYTNSTGTVLTFAASWNGSTWRVVTTPSDPAGSKSAELGAVACSKATDCTAVGSYETSTSQSIPLVERYTGSSWHIAASAPKLAPLGTALNGVSCNTSGCTVVGDKVTDSAGDTAVLAEHWNYSTWTLESPLQPAQAPDAELAALSCVGTSCMAGGSYAPANGAEVVFSETLSNTTWTVRAMPAGGVLARTTVLNAVTCPSPTACTAVGASYGQTLAEQWNGKSWVLQLPPNPSESTYADELLAVGCSSVGACTAVGDMLPDSGSSAGIETLADRWNGTRWTSEATPNAANTATDHLTGVACPSATTCIAVGYSTSLYNDMPASDLVERWNGRSWSIVSTPNPDPQQGAESRLSGIACSSATDCTAVGYYDNTSFVPVPLVESWNGTKWSIVPAPSPSGTARASLTSVSCPSAGFCAAVGNDLVTGQVDTPSTFAESWNGQTWSVEAMAPTLTNVINVDATGVSCASPTSCVATGYAQLNVGGPAQIDVFGELWSGASWAASSPSVPGTSEYSQLNGVGCALGSPTSCTAVGFYAAQFSDTEYALAERYAG